MSPDVNRRQFIAATTSAGVGLALTGASPAAEKPALLGGNPVRAKGYQSWPTVAAADEKAVWEVVRAGRWYRNRSVSKFEETFAKLNADKCYAFHNCCRRRQGAGGGFAYQGGRNTNVRMTEFQGALLLSQVAGLKQQAKIRSENADYLSGMLREIPGIVPARMYEGCTRNAYHTYMFRYQPEEFSNLPRVKFPRALHAEGIPCSGGYSPLNKAGFIRDALHSRPYVRLYGKAAIEKWAQRNDCPENDKLCGEAVCFMQNMFLGPRSDMDQIAEAIRKIRAHAPALARA